MSSDTLTAKAHGDPSPRSGFVRESHDEGVRARRHCAPGEGGFLQAAGFRIEDNKLVAPESATEHVAVRSA